MSIETSIFIEYVLVHFEEYLTIFVQKFKLEILIFQQPTYKIHIGSVLKIHIHFAHSIYI